MKRMLGDSNGYSSVPPKKEKMRLDSQSSDGGADGSFYNDDEYEDEYEDEHVEEGDEEDEEEEEYEDAKPADARPICKYGTGCYRTNPTHLADFQHPTTTTTPTKKSPATKQITKKQTKKKPHSFAAPPAFINHYTGPRVVPPEFLEKSKTTGVSWTLYAMQKSTGNLNDAKNSTDPNNSSNTTTSSNDNRSEADKTTPKKGDNKTKETEKTSPSKTPKKEKGAKDSSPAKAVNKSTPSSPSSSSTPATFQPLSDNEIQALFEPYPELKGKFDRSGSVLATKFMKLTAVNGLPLFQSSNPSFNKELIHCINYIFWRVKNEQDKDKKKENILYLADAYSSCQAVQATAILSTFSKLTNVDMTFQDQVRNLLDDFKGRSLDQLVLSIHPDANIVPDSNPAGQAPHIRSAYLLILDRNGVDLPGKQVALIDSSQPHPPPSEAQRVVSSWPSLFSVDLFISEFVSEINQGSNAKFLDHSKFYQWVNTLDDKVGFDKHSVFYDEERKEEYERPQREEDHLVLPYLSTKVAKNVLCKMGLVSEY